MKKSKKILVYNLSLILIIFIYLFIPYFVSGSYVINSAHEFIGSAAEDGRNNIALNEDVVQYQVKFLQNLLLVIGIIVAFIFGLFLAIQYITGSVEKKVDVKKTLIPYVFGVVLLFGAYAIWRIAVNIASSFTKSF